jgi:hypothetical protein
MALLTHLEFKHKPILNKVEMFSSKIIKLLFTVILTVYVGLWIKQDHISAENSNFYFGWLILFFYVVVILISCLHVFLELWTSFLACITYSCCRKKKK